MNPWFFSVTTSLIASVIFAAAGHFFGKRSERRRSLARVYDALDPVLRAIGDMRRAGKLQPHDAQGLVRLLSSQLAAHFAGGSETLSDYWRDEWLNVIRKECGICGLPPDVARDGRSCAACRLNCCAWNF